MGKLRLRLQVKKQDPRAEKGRGRPESGLLAPKHSGAVCSAVFPSSSVSLGRWVWGQLHGTDGNKQAQSKGREESD